MRHARVDHVGDAVGQHARLARASSCQHEERTVSGQDGLFLRRVQRIYIDGHEGLSLVMGIGKVP